MPTSRSVGDAAGGHGASGHGTNGHGASGHPAGVNPRYAGEGTQYDPRNKFFVQEREGDEGNPRYGGEGS